MNKLSDNEIKSIRDAIQDLTILDRLIVYCKNELTTHVLHIIEETGKEFGYELLVTVSDYFSKIMVTTKRIK